MRYTVAATVRNEGPFLLEWLAWQKMLGFDDVLFVYNDCTDHSPELMAKLAAHGLCHAVEHHPPEGVAPVRSGLDTIHNHPVVAQTDWLFVCDVDEYLVPADGQESVRALLDGYDQKFAAVSVQWKSFGTNGLELWEDAFLHRTFVGSAPSQSVPNAFFKTFIYKPGRFKRLGAHAPRKFKGDWGRGANKWGHIAGRGMNVDPNGETRKRTKPEFVSHKGAQLNHYILKWQESFEFKRGRPCPLRATDFDRYNDTFFERYNVNDEMDLSAVALTEKFQEHYDAIVAIPGVLPLHHACCADYVRAMCEKRGEDPERDPRYIHHMGLAHTAA